MIDPTDTVTLPLPVTTETPIRMRFASADHSYAAWLTQDLFGTWTVCNRGAANSRSAGTCMATNAWSESW